MSGNITTKREIERLLAGEEIVKEIRQELTYQEMYQSVENIWSLLFMTGYLTQRQRLDASHYKLAIPNLEVRDIFKTQIMEYFKEGVAKDGDTLKQLCDALKGGDAEKVERLFEGYLKKTISIRDTFVEKSLKENFYHGILLGILGVKEDWGVFSNRETGDGYSDIMIETEDSEMGTTNTVFNVPRNGRLDIASTGRSQSAGIGPVRTGKSTFIKRFMDLLVLPNMTDIHAKERTQDELPQSASGTTIMTTEPKFVPKEAAGVKLSDDLEVKIRMIDCVGFMSEGASGHIEKDEERQVKTPWFEYEIPFTKAAAIGTQKVIRDHATIGIVVTTDGSVTDLPRENYIQAEERTVKELKAIGKPFMILLNCKKPYTEESKKLQEELREKYETAVLPVNCEQMKEEDIHEIMRQVLYEFPVTEVEFYVPKWVEMLSREHKIKQDLFEHVRKIMETMDDIRSVVSRSFEAEGPYIERILTEKIEMDTGKVQVKIEFAESYYYEVISEVTGEEIHGEYELMAVMKELSAMREEFSRIKDAFADVKMKGYGVVSPSKEDIRLEEPVIIKQGSKFGVKIRSEAPSIHMIRANIETEIAPIVGNEKQAEDLAGYIKKESETPEGVWGTNIFGKTVEELVMDGMRNKIAMINDESQVKLQDSMQKIVNDSNGGMVCIII